MSSTRSTVFSPKMTGVVDTRMSTALPSMFISIWPSCARRRSTMFMPAMTLMRLTIAGPISAGSVEHVVERAVDAHPDPDLLALRLDVHVGRTVTQRLGEDEVDHLDDRRVLVDRLLQRRIGGGSTTRDRRRELELLMWCATSASAL